VGCLRHLLAGLGCLVVVLAALVAGWIFRDRLEALYHRLRGGPAPAPVVYAAPAAGGPARAEAQLAELGRRGGPAYVDLSAGDLATLLDRELALAPRRAFDSVGVALGDQHIRVRGVLDVSTLPRKLLGPLAEGLGRREPVVAGGTLAVPADGRVMWTIDELTVRDFPFPRRVIPAIVNALHVPDAQGAAVPIPLPAMVGDVRVSPTGVRVYRASPR
jgi:hypothetical protein